MPRERLRVVAVLDGPIVPAWVERVLLDLATETYYGLDEVGARFWSVLTAAATIDDGVSVLLGEYDVAPDVLRRDVSTLLSSLAERGLVGIRRA